MANKLNIPEGYQTVMPYLLLKDPLRFLDFTARVFNATEKYKHIDPDNTFRHGEIRIGDSTIMFAGCGDRFQEQTAGLYIHVEDADASYKKALEEGATSVMEPSNQSYGRSSGVLDPCGNTWWITSELK